MQADSLEVFEFYFASRRVQIVSIGRVATVNVSTKPPLSLLRVIDLHRFVLPDTIVDLAQTAGRSLLTNAPPGCIVQPAPSRKISTTASATLDITVSVERLTI